MMKLRIEGVVALRKIRMFAATAMLVLIAAAPVARAGVTVLVDDHAEDPIALHLLGNAENSSIQITQEGVGILGAADVHFEYLSTDPNVPSLGQTFTYNGSSLDSPVAARAYANQASGGVRRRERSCEPSTPSQQTAPSR